jgi:hypothetical protein
VRAELPALPALPAPQQEAELHNRKMLVAVGMGPRFKPRSADGQPEHSLTGGTGEILRSTLKSYGPEARYQTSKADAGTAVWRENARRHPCQRPAIRGRKRCRLHGGMSPGAPRGSKNGNFKSGDWTTEAIEERKWLRSLVHSLESRRSRAALKIFAAAQSLPSTTKSHFC